MGSHNSGAGPFELVLIHRPVKGLSQIHLSLRYMWFERGVKEAIFVKLEQPSLNKGGGLRHNLSSVNNSFV